ncbi:hypothetical protein B0J13DRAFT_392531, partial [Dactylonectria estremocensis]
FIHLTDHPIIVCKHCHFAYVAQEAGSHLKAEHPGITAKERKSIITAIQGIPGLIQDQAELLQWTLPPPHTTLIPYIKPPMKDGLGCNACLYVARSRNQMVKHCCKEHGWTNSRKRGRCAKGSEAGMPAVPWRSNVQCQRLFKTRVASSWFEVGREIP